MQCYDGDSASVRHRREGCDIAVQVRIVILQVVTILNSRHKDALAITRARVSLSKFCDVFEHIDQASQDDRYAKLDTTAFSAFLGFNVRQQQDVGDYVDKFGDKFLDAVALCIAGKVPVWRSRFNCECSNTEAEPS
jgi:hypothetical protein